jgi:hypothetical protein
MLTVSVCYSNRAGQEFASCTLGGVELGIELLDQPAVLAAAIRRAYDRCHEAVDAQLAAAATVPAAATTASAPAAELPLDRRHLGSPPHAASPTTLPPAVTSQPGARPHYGAGGQGKGRGQDGPPSTGPQLGGWAKKRDALPWFEAFGLANNLPKLCSQWSDEWAQYAFAEYGKACVPPVPSTNGHGRPPY